MSATCHHTAPVFDGVSPAYRRVLWVVIAINGIMAAGELTAGILTGSQALQADALDFVGDTATYAITLLVIGRSLATRARAALFKGVSLAVLGLWVLGSTVHAVFTGGVPEPVVMGGVGFLALGANLASVTLLYRFRAGDANVRSVWLCSRNDAIGNIAVVLAAAGVWATSTGWPDLAVAAVMASLFLWSSVLIIRQAVAELRAVRAGPKKAEASGLRPGEVRIAAPVPGRRKRTP